VDRISPEQTGNYSDSAKSNMEVQKAHTRSKYQFFDCNPHKFTTDPRRSPPSLPLLIIEMQTSSWLTLSKLRGANENRRSGEEPQPYRVLFIGPSKRLKTTMPLGPNTLQTAFWGRRVRRSPSHRSIHLELPLDTISAMMPRAPPIVTPLPVLRPDWKTLA
jgi:hypothetical protein